jgi:hypothetical protein
MSIEAARKLIEHLDARIEESSSGKVFFSDERYTAFPLLPTNFKRIRVGEVCRQSLSRGKAERNIPGRSTGCVGSPILQKRLYDCT